MVLLIETTAHTQDGIEIVSHLIEADAEGGQEFFGFHNSSDESDSFAIAEIILGEAEIVGDGFETDEQLTQGRYRGFRYDANQGFGNIGVSIRLTAGATVSLLFGRVRRGIGSVIGRVSCKLCKAAVMAIVRAALALAGIPFPLAGTDLAAVRATFETALDAMAQGNVNTALQSLISLLPSTVWDAIKDALHVVNWIWDSIDKLIERVCTAIGLCPPQRTQPP